MKKLLCILLALLMIASVALVACDKDEEPDLDNDLGLGLDNTPSDSDDATESDDTAVTEPVTYEFQDVNETVYVQNCVKVNVRSTPTTAGNNVVGSVEFGAQYKRVKYNAQWSGLEVNGEILYVNTYFLTTSPAEVVFEMKEDTPSVIYVTNIDADTGAAGNLNLRTFTSTNPDSSFHPNGNVGTVAKHGAALTVTGISNDGHWYRVDFNTTDDNGQPKTIKNLYVYNGKYVTTTAPAAAQ